MAAQSRGALSRDDPEKESAASVPHRRTQASSRQDVGPGRGGGRDHEVIEVIGGTSNAGDSPMEAQAGKQEFGPNRAL